MKKLTLNNILFSNQNSEKNKKLKNSIINTINYYNEEYILNNIYKLSKIYSKSKKKELKTP